MRYLCGWGVIALLAGGCAGNENQLGGKDSEETDPATVDADGDGWTADDDCDDGNAAVNPGATEICNTLDDDCDGATDDVDADGDGAIDATCEGGDDCDDGDNSVNPGAPEICDGRDQDCDGEADNGLKMPWYRDADEDGWGTDTDVLELCAWPIGYANRSGDCDDTDPAVNPDAAETVNGRDDNCDGTADVGALLPDGSSLAGYTCGNGSAFSDPTGYEWVAGVVGNDPTGSGSTFWVDGCGWLAEASIYGFWIPEGTSLDVARVLESPAFISVLTGDLCANSEVGDGLEHYWHNPLGCSGE